jgi:hypothetical protein
MNTPVICHIASAKPDTIEKIFAMDPDHPARLRSTFTQTLLQLTYI